MVLTQMYFMWWTVPVSTYSFFCFFVLCEDAVAEYPQARSFLLFSHLRVAPVAPTVDDDRNRDERDAHRHRH
ncbi:hypothetical protein B0H14DRAFT_3472840 [Mycena olivaceomarginata]|nr:hypothetical protein B0H14DRAFT_3472840 [Mycena olivaceomarginata]